MRRKAFLFCLAPLLVHAHMLWLKIRQRAGCIMFTHGTMHTRTVRRERGHT